MVDNLLILLYNTTCACVAHKYGPLVKRLRRRPLTAETGVRFPYGLLPNAIRNSLVAFLFHENVENACFFHKYVIQYFRKYRETVKEWARVHSLNVVRTIQIRL